jgi:chlorobactene glucosyltransferase
MIEYLLYEISQSSWITWYKLVVAGIIAFVSLFGLINTIWIRVVSNSRNRKEFMPGSVPSLSICIPARDEELNIGPCLENLLKQDYENFEIIVLNDNSSDRTATIVNEFCARDSRVKLVEGKKTLGRGWHGKPHAMQQILDHTTGEILVFTDADVVHEPSSISFMVSKLLEKRADFMSGYTRQVTRSLGEAIIVPCTMLTSIFFPLWLIPGSTTGALSHAIGQVMVYKRDVLDKLKGFRRVRRKVSEDLFMSREVKKAGYKVYFLDMKKYVSTRMYQNGSQAFHGITKNIYDFFLQKVSVLVAVTLLILTVFIAPIVLSAWSYIANGTLDPVLSLSVLLFFSVWTIVMIDRGFPWYYSFYYPFMLIAVALMGWNYIFQVSVAGGINWKGRIVK